MLEKIVSILFPMFALVFVGFITTKLLKPDYSSINRINMYVLIPALVFASLVNMPLNLDQVPLIMAALVAILLPGLLMLVVCHFAKLNYRAWAPPNMFRNSGNLAIPLFTYTFGETALAPAVLLFVVSASLHSTLGLAIMSKENPLKLILKTPLFYAAFAALAVNLSGIDVWQPLYEASDLLGGAAVPIMLLSLGAQMINMQWSGLRPGVLGTVLSIATGAVSYLVIYLFIPLSTLHLQMMVLFAMLPPAVMNFVFAEQFQAEPRLVATKVLFSNFFTIITLPLLLSFALTLG